MGDSAASAAYWLAAYSDTIYANPSTLTGSIGVYMPYMNTQELFKKIGIYTTKIKSGQYKDIMSADRPMTPEEQQILQNMVNQMFENFVAVIAEGRKMDIAKVKALADGRVYPVSRLRQSGLSMNLAIIMTLWRQQVKPSEWMEYRKLKKTSVKNPGKYFSVPSYLK